MGIINIVKVEVMANTRRGRIQMMGVRLVEPGENVLVTTAHPCHPRNGYVEVKVQFIIVKY